MSGSGRRRGLSPPPWLRGRRTRRWPRPPPRTGFRPASPAPSAVPDGTIRPVGRRPLCLPGRAPRPGRRASYGRSRTHRASDLARHRNPGTRRPGPFPSPIDGSAPYGPKISTGAPAPRHARRTRNITSGASPRRDTPPSSVGAPNSLKGHREQPRDGPLERGAERHGANSQPRGSFLVRSTSLSGTMAQ